MAFFVFANHCRLGIAGGHFLGSFHRSIGDGLAGHSGGDAKILQLVEQCDKNTQMSLVDHF